MLILLVIFLNNDFVKSQNFGDTIKINQININNKKNINDYTLLIYKIDSNILAEESNNSLSEILNNYTPIFVKNYGKTSLSTVSIRGTSASHTDVLWNGISLKSPMLGQVDFSLIPSNLFNNIYINYGGSSIINTSGALGGSVNLLNNTNWNNKISFKLTQDIGSYSTINNFIEVNLGKSNFQSSTKLYNNYSKNDFEFKNKNIAKIDVLTGEYIYPIQKNTNAKFHQKGFMQSFSYKKNNLISNINFWHQSSNRSIPRLNTYEGDDYSNINNENSIDNILSINTTYYFKKSKLYFNNALVNKNINYKLKNYISGLGYNNIINSIGLSNSYYNNINYIYNFNNTLSLACTYSFNYHKVETIEQIKKSGYNKTRNENFFSLNLSKSIFNRLTSSIIIRKNLIDNKNIPIIAFAGLDFLILKKINLHIKSSISDNYNFPSLNDLFWQPGGNPNLLTEESKTVDFTLETTKKINRFNLKISSTYYFSKISNWIIWLPSPQGYWSPYNIKGVNSNGLSLNFNLLYKIKKTQINIATNCSYTKSINNGDSTLWGESFNKQLPYIPVYSANSFINFKHNNYYISYIFNYYSERYTSSAQEISLRDWLYPYYMNDISIGKILFYKTLSFDIKFKIYNLLNEEYRTVLGRPMPGRNYLIELKIKFN